MAQAQEMAGDFDDGTGDAAGIARLSRSKMENYYKELDITHQGYRIVSEMFHSFIVTRRDGSQLGEYTTLAEAIDAIKADVLAWAASLKAEDQDSEPSLEAESLDAAEPSTKSKR